jgi:hypothetical protein
VDSFYPGNDFGKASQIGVQTWESVGEKSPTREPHRGGTFRGKHVPLGQGGTSGGVIGAVTDNLVWVIDPGTPTPALRATHSDGGDFSEGGRSLSLA